MRELYLDRLRVLLTALVIVHHTAITYGAMGGNFYIELHPSATLSSRLLTLFTATNQAHFMGFFFLVSGYFTPASLARQGYSRFLCNRFLRLGLPLLFFTLLLGPFTVALANHSAANPLIPSLLRLWRNHALVPGPLWFTEALLLFSLLYAAGRSLLRRPLAQNVSASRPIPPQRQWLLAALAVGAAAFLIRLAIPVGQTVFSLQLGYFSSYIFLFFLGIAAARYDWFHQLQPCHARPWLIALPFVWLTLPLSLALFGRRPGATPYDFLGGLNASALFYAFWEPFLAWGIIAGLLLFFRRYLNQPSAVWQWLSRRAYAAFILHSPVLVAVALAFQHWPAPALAKFGLTATLTCFATWLLADPFVRLPGLRRIL